MGLRPPLVLLHWVAEGAGSSASGFLLVWKRWVRGGWDAGVVHAPASFLAGLVAGNVAQTSESAVLPSPWDRIHLAGQWREV